MVGWLVCRRAPCVSRQNLLVTGTQSVGQKKLDLETEKGNEKGKTNHKEDERKVILVLNCPTSVCLQRTGFYSLRQGSYELWKKF